LTLAKLPGWLPYAEVHGSNNTVTGTVVVWPRLASPKLGRAREMVVYLPPSLAAGMATEAAGGVTGAAAPGRRYPVLYFHDGQNVFDERTSFVGEWKADETLQKLASEGIEAIAVAVPNGGDARMDEYNPWRERNFLRGRKGDVGGKGDEYMEWLVESVKPLIDRSFPTRPDREATGIVGSSMGGLISLYGAIKYPEVFGLVGAMSASVRWNRFRIIRLIEEGRMPPARIHVDMGGREWRGMMDDARRLRDALIGKGWVEGRNLHYVEERYATHHEDAWARRLPDALRFLLAETAPKI
jgi:predicted alpha/beta superfamily hydrolase